MSSRASDCRLRDVTLVDRPMIWRWLRQPDVASWWGNAPSGVATVSTALASSTAICRIIERQGAEPIGYVQALDCGALGALASTSLMPGAWQCDAFIAVAGARGKSYGRSAVDLVVREVFSSSLALTCTVMLPIRREQTARAYESIGFHWVRIVDDALLGPCWLMQRDRGSS